ncbi:rhamnogalacturonan lyase B N-terminal domain-containing protein [Paenibacillus tundrae]
MNKIRKTKKLMKATSIVLAAFIFVFVLLVPEETASAAPINVIENGSKIVVNTGAGLEYTIDKNNGNMISAILNGTELTGSKPSHINSGLWGTTVSWVKSPSGGTVIITVDTDTLTHYYVSRSGENIIYMATYTTAQPGVGELRYIFRGNSDILTDIPTNADLWDNTGAIESKDIYGFSNGYSASKFYGNEQAKDLNVQGATGNNFGVFMAYGNRETSSGGPFFRDIQFQRAADTEVYNYMNSGHAQTEDFRVGLHGPYALIFTNGSTPSIPDFKWMSSLGLTGWVNSRGNVVLNNISGMESGYTYTVGFANRDAQYWTTASTSGTTAMYNMKPGIYTMKIYKGELAVHSEDNVTVAGENKTTFLNERSIDNDPSTTPYVWRIGTWDGSPTEFLNGQMITSQHPSDGRNANWGPLAYTIGNPVDQFPAIQFRGANDPTLINFTLSAEEAASPHMLKIGITTAYNGGRPKVSINDIALKNPSASFQPNSRDVTIGTYRGNNVTYSYYIPASHFVAGTNTIGITAISGSPDLSPWLSAGFAYDVVELGD